MTPLLLTHGTRLALARFDRPAVFTTLAMSGADRVMLTWQDAVAGTSRSDLAARADVLRVLRGWVAELEGMV